MAALEKIRKELQTAYETIAKRDEVIKLSENQLKSLQISNDNLHYSLESLNSEYEELKQKYELLKSQSASHTPTHSKNYQSSDSFIFDTSFQHKNSTSPQSHLSSLPSFELSPIRADVSMSSENKEHTVVHLLQQSNRQIASYENAIEELEFQNRELKDTVENLNSQLENSNKTAARNLKRCEDEVKELKAELSSHEQDFEVLKADREKLIKEKTELSRKLKSLVEVDNSRSMTSEKTEEKLIYLENTLKAVENQRSYFENVSKEAKQEIVRLREQLSETQINSDQITGYQETIASNQERIEELEFDLERSFEQIAKLQERLAVLEPLSNVDDSEVDHKTLFSEVDDRRQELESEHKQLVNDYDGLVKKFKVTVNREERLKNHISRLNMVNNASAAEDEVAVLEQTLVQLKSENFALTNKLEVLQQQVDISMIAENPDVLAVDADGEKDHEQNQLDLIEFLRNQVESMTEEIQTLRHELRTTQLLKRNETDKVQAAEVARLARENHISMLKSQLAQTKFELEEIKRRQKKTNATDLRTNEKSETAGTVPSKQPRRKASEIAVNKDTQPHAKISHQTPSPPLSSATLIDQTPTPQKLEMKAPSPKTVTDNAKISHQKLPPTLSSATSIDQSPTFQKPDIKAPSVETDTENIPVRKITTDTNSLPVKTSASEPLKPTLSSNQNTVTEIEPPKQIKVKRMEKEEECRQQ